MGFADLVLDASHCILSPPVDGFRVVLVGVSLKDFGLRICVVARVIRQVNLLELSISLKVEMAV